MFSSWAREANPTLVIHQPDPSAEWISCTGSNPKEEPHLIIYDHWGSSGGWVDMMSHNWPQYPTLLSFTVE